MDLKNMIIEYIVRIVLVVISSTIITMTYYFTDKKKNDKRKLSSYELIFLFGIWYVIFDFIKKVTKKSEKINKTSVVIIGISLITFSVFNIAIPNIAFPETSKISFTQKYYDKNGISYNKLEEVIYYTKDGCQYRFDEDNLTFVCEYKTEDSNYNDSYKVGYAYVDKDGYLILTDYIFEFDEKLFDSNEGFFNYDFATNKYYMDAEFARWNKEGQLHFLGHK